MDRKEIIAEIDAFQAETGVTNFAICKKAGVGTEAIYRIHKRNATPNGDTIMKLREAMAFFRAQIKARLEKAAEEGRQQGSGAA